MRGCQSLNGNNKARRNEEGGEGIKITFSHCFGFVQSSSTISGTTSLRGKTRQYKNACQNTRL